LENKNGRLRERHGVRNLRIFGSVAAGAPSEKACGCVRCGFTAPLEWSWKKNQAWLPLEFPNPSWRSSAFSPRRRGADRLSGDSRRLPAAASLPGWKR
jgi:hypothetical protein